MQGMTRFSSLKDFKDWQGKYWIYTGVWIGPTELDLSPEDLATYHEDYKRRRAIVEGGEEPECRCYCVGDQADASDCPLHRR